MKRREFVGGSTAALAVLPLAEIRPPAPAEWKARITQMIEEGLEQLPILCVLKQCRVSPVVSNVFVSEDCRFISATRGPSLGNAPWCHLGSSIHFDGHKTERALAEEAVEGIGNVLTRIRNAVEKRGREDGFEGRIAFECEPFQIVALELGESVPEGKRFNLSLNEYGTRGVTVSSRFKMAYGPFA